LDSALDLIQTRIDTLAASEGIESWPIFDNLAPALRLKTNYAAKQLICRENKKVSSELLKRIDSDTEAGAVCTDSATQQDIREAAEVLNRLFAERPGFVNSARGC
jgi:hypothetical protein